jgi:endonuclease/exonuclease/phosphatase family metal-dependent hydrolase
MGTLTTIGARFMELDPRIRIRPWQTALLAVVLATGLAVLLANVVWPLGSGPPGVDPAPAAVSSDPPPAQELVPPLGPIAREGNAPSGQAPQPPAPAPTKVTCVPQTSDVGLSVLSFNTHSARGGGLRMKEIASEIAAWDADIVLLQEVDLNRAYTRHTDQAGFYASRLGMEFAYGAGARKGRGQIGQATLSRYPIVEQSNTLLPHQPGLPKAQQRGVLNTRVQVGQTVISVYNTHLQHIHDELRLRQMRSVATLVAADPLPIILGGDLNSAPRSPMLSVARGVLEDAWDAVGVGAGNTIPPSRPSVRIDYVMYSDPLVPRSAQTLRSRVSDHRAVLAHFTLSADGEPICVPILTEPLD